MAQKAAGSIPARQPKGGAMDREAITEEQWRHIAVVALADLQAIGMDLSHFLDQIGVDQDTVLKEIDRYMWDRENYR